MRRQHPAAGSLASTTSVDAGPHPGPDGLAHLTVAVPGFPPRQPPGTSTFALALKVQPSVTLAIVPSQFDLGSWKVMIEAAEVTPSVITCRQ
jgi:hypothetical protein